MNDTSPIDERDAMLSGSHTLTARLSSAPATQPTVRRKRAGLLLGLLGGVVVVATITALQLTANLGYDTAETQVRLAGDAVEDVKVAVEAANSDLRDIEAAAGLLVDGDTGALVDAEAKDTVSADAATAAEVLTSTDSLLAEQIPAVDDKPLWFWDLYAQTGVLDEDRRSLERLDEQLRDEALEIETAESALTTSGAALLASAASSAAAQEAAHRSARNADVIALRDAAAAVSALTTIDDDAVTAFAALQSAAAQVISSEKAELAEKAGPLKGARLEVEAFARSLAPGVLLDFDWAPIINGAGSNGSMGGYTTWWYDKGGYATIQLSDSVAEQWPQARSKALIAHEVGHAISVKCSTMYDSSTQDSIEKWATGWAISMGYTDDANGVWAYGYPPQSYIDAAAGCR